MLVILLKIKEMGMKFKPESKAESKLKYPEVEANMLSWMDMLKEQGAIINDFQVHRKANEFLNALKLEDFKISTG